MIIVAGMEKLGMNSENKTFQMANVYVTSRVPKIIHFCQKCTRNFLKHC